MSHIMKNYTYFFISCAHVDLYAYNMGYNRWMIMFQTTQDIINVISNHTKRLNPTHFTQL